MSNARKLADNLPTDGQLGNRNLVTNGSMIISQRSTSVSSQTGSGYKTIDRFRVNASGATYNQSQQTVTVGGETGLPTEFTKFLRHECTSGNDNHFLMTRIEDVAKFQGDMVLSFYAKGSNPSTLGKLSVKFHQSFGSGGSSDVYTTVQDLTLTSTWQRFTFKVTMASISGKTVGNGNYGSFLIGQDTDTSTDAWTLDITGVQLEVGSQSTPFEHEPYETTLRKCQRYFQHHQGNYYTIFLNGSIDTTSAYLSGPLTQVMRVKPSFSTANCYLYARPTGSLTYTSTENRCNTSFATIGFHGISGSIANSAGMRFESDNNNGYVRYDAEL